jgi:predicted metalloprotease
VGLLVILLLFPVGAAAAQSTDSCRYINPDGSLSGALYVSLEGCAQAVLDETLRLRQPEGIGLYGEYALRVTQSGEVYAASTRGVSSVSRLNWQFLGTISIRAAQPTPVPPTPTAMPTRAPATTAQGSRDTLPGVVPTSLEQIFEIAAEDINTFWQQQFSAYGYPYREPRVVLHDRAQISTGCGVAPAQVGPFYCSADHSMYYPFRFMDQQWKQFGDFAVVTIIAHEWGHAVQGMLGVLNTGGYTIDMELQADCFAGAYARYANTESMNIRLDQSDIREGAVALFNAGDPDGTPWWDSQAHGTGDQRVEAFSDGFQLGVSTC